MWTGGKKGIEVKGEVVGKWMKNNLRSGRWWDRRRGEEGRQEEYRGKRLKREQRGKESRWRIKKKETEEGTKTKEERRDTNKRRFRRKC